MLQYYYLQTVTTNILKPLLGLRVSESDSVIAQELLPRPITPASGESSKTSSVNSPTNTELNGTPIMPLRERDLTAMTALFEGEDGDEIEADIDDKLPWLGPTPCWEDDPFDFLREYL